MMPVFFGAPSLLPAILATAAALWVHHVLLGLLVLGALALGWRTYRRAPKARP